MRGRKASGEGVSCERVQLTGDGAVKTPGNHGEEPEEVSNEVLVVSHSCNEKTSTSRECLLF